MRVVSRVAAIAVLCAATVAALRSPRPLPAEDSESSPSLLRRVLAWLTRLLLVAVLVGIVVHLATSKLDGMVIEWTIFSGTLIGGLALALAFAGAIVRSAPHRETWLLLAQTVGVWVVCIGSLVEISLGT